LNQNFKNTYKYQGWIIGLKVNLKGLLLFEYLIKNIFEFFSKNQGKFKNYQTKLTFINSKFITLIFSYLKEIKKILSNQIIKSSLIIFYEIDFLVSFLILKSNFKIQKIYTL